VECQESMDQLVQRVKWGTGARVDLPDQKERLGTLEVLGPQGCRACGEPQEGPGSKE